MIRKRNVYAFVAVTLLLLLGATVLGRAGFALIEEGRDLQFVDDAFRHIGEGSVDQTMSGSEKARLDEPIDFALIGRMLSDRAAERQRRMIREDLDEEPEAATLDHVLEYVASAERAIAEFARGLSNTEAYRSFRQTQANFWLSRPPPPKPRAGLQGDYDSPAPPRDFFSHPTLREVVVRECLEHVEEGLWDDSVAAQCWNWIGIVGVDRTRDRLQIADFENSLRGALEAFKEATDLDSESLPARWNLEVLLTYLKELEENESPGKGGQGDNGDPDQEDGQADDNDGAAGDTPGRGDY